MKEYVLIALSLLLAGCASDVRLISRASESEQKTTDSQRLFQLFHDYFEEYLRLFPVFATSIGDHRYDDRFGIPISKEHRKDRHALYTKYLRELSQLPIQMLDSQDRLHYEVFQRELETRLEGLRFQQHLMPVRQIDSTPVNFPLMGSGRGVHPFKTTQDYDNFLKRMERFEVWGGTAIANMRKGMDLGIVQPKVVMERTLPQLEAMLVPDVRQSIFYQPMLQMPATFKEVERNRLAQAYAQAIERHIIPAYKRLRDFISDEYLPKSRATVALSDLPGGRDWYAFLVKTQTTTSLTPDEIFATGMREVERIEQEIERMKEGMGFRGSLAAYSRYLAQKAGPAYASKEDLIKAYQELRAGVAPQLSKLFGRMPRAPYEIRPVEEYREQSASSQYWSGTADGSRPGIFYVNAAAIKQRPMRPSVSLFLHEAVPGHHFQISIQREQNSLPRFTRFGSYTAFVEGWGLYAESLGKELGLYSDPYQYFNWLSAEMWRAIRLVVDVGLHHKGWTREQALRFMREHSTTSEVGALREIDRYIARPGQALAYKIGQLKISALRAKAEKVLGSRFDIREFHDELLKDGALPLDLLEAKMDAWISRRR